MPFGETESIPTTRKLTSSDARRHVDTQYNLRDVDPEVHRILPHTIVTAFDGPAVIVLENWKITPSLTTPKLMLGVDEALDADIHGNFVYGVRNTGYPGFIVPKINERQRYIAESEASRVKVPLYTRSWEEEKIAKLQESLERRRQLITPETIVLLNDVYKERLQICREFQVNLYQEALEGMPWVDEVQALFKMIHLLSAAEKPTMTPAPAPEYIIKETARKRVSEYRGIKPEKNPLTGEVTYKDVKKKDDYEYGKSLNDEMLRLSNYMEIPQKGVERADPRKVLYQACENVIANIVRENFRQMGDYCHLAGFATEDADSFVMLGTPWDVTMQVHGISRQATELKVEVDRESGQIKLFNKDGIPVYPSPIPGIPHDRNVFNVMRLGLNAYNKGEVLKRECELVRNRITLSQKMISEIVEIMKILAESDGTLPVDYMPQLQKAAARAKPYSKDIAAFYRPYLIDTEITVENIDEMGVMIGYLELVRRGKDKYPGFNARGGKQEPEDAFSESQSKSLNYMGDDEAEAANLPPEHFRKTSKIPALGIRVERGFPPGFIEDTTRVYKEAKDLTKHDHPVLNDKSLYVVQPMINFVSTGADSMKVPHGDMAVPIQVILRIKDDTTVQPVKFQYQVPVDKPKGVSPFGTGIVGFGKDIMRMKDGTYQIRVPEQFKNRSGIVVEVLLQSADEQMAPEELVVSNRQGISALRRIIQELRETSPSLGYLADKLEHSIEEMGGVEFVNLNDIAGAIADSSQYTLDGSKHVVNLNKPIPHLPHLIDPQTGLLKMQCNLSNQLAAYVISQIVAYDPEMSVYVASGYAVDNSRAVDGVTIVSEAQTHAIVKLMKRNKVAYVDAVPYLLQGGDIFELPQHIRDRAVQSLSASHGAVEDIDIQVNIARILEDNPIAQLEYQMKDEIKQEISRSRSSFVRKLDRMLGGYLTMKEESAAEYAALDIVVKRSLSPELPLGQLIAVTNKFLSGRLDSSEFYTQIIEINDSLKRFTQEGFLRRISTGNSIGLNNAQEYPEVFFAMQKLIEEIKDSMER